MAPTNRIWGHIEAGIRENIMQVKQAIMALGVIGISVLLPSASAHATSGKTETNKKSKPVVVTVKAGDTLDSIAKKHNRTYVQLFNANKNIINPDVIDVGDKVRIPKNGEKLPDRFDGAPVAYTTETYTTQQYTTAPVNENSYYVGNGMWCTDYVHSKRSDIPVYGNAGYGWISAAQADGKSTGSSPKAGAVAVMNGHVAYVEKVNADGSYVVSEMGWNYQAGNYNKRTVQPGTFGGFIY